MAAKIMGLNKNNNQRLANITSLNEESETGLSGLSLLVSESLFNLINPLGPLITITKNPQNTLELFSESETDSFDAIILDSDEIETANVIRSVNRSDSYTIPIIAITDNRPFEISTGINALITKPIDEKSLCIALLKCMLNSSLARIKMLNQTLDCLNKDGLTGVNNRMAFENFEEKITQEIAANKISSFAIIIFDSNNLKNTNDLLGHDAGDQLIIDGCKIICNTFKHSPVFRVGGDEFVAFLQGEDYENRKNLLSGFQKKMNKEYFISGAVSIASGISDFIPQKDINLTDVFKRADESMYKTKAKMKNQKLAKPKT